MQQREIKKEAATLKRLSRHSSEGATAEVRKRANHRGAIHAVNANTAMPMPTPHFYYVYILRDVATGKRHYTGVTHDLQERLAMHNAGHMPHTSKFTPLEIHSAIAVQTEQQASALEQYLKSHSGREWVIKHLGLPVGMKSAN